MYNSIWDIALTGGRWILDIFDCVRFSWKYNSLAFVWFDFVRISVTDRAQSFGVSFDEDRLHNIAITDVAPNHSTMLRKGKIISLAFLHISAVTVSICSLRGRRQKRRERGKKSEWGWYKPLSLEIGYPVVRAITSSLFKIEVWF